MSDDFLSGHSGYVAGPRAITRARLVDARDGTRELARLQRLRLRRAAAAAPRRRVLVLAIERRDVPNVLPQARRELERSRHRVEFASIDAARGGKFENLGTLLAEHPPGGQDWLIALDDDVELPRGFLDRFVFLAERFGLRIAQPAHRCFSHAAFAVTRRHAGSVVRETSFVETGPVTAFHAATFDVLLPFPRLRAGWGLDAHWSAVARERHWPIGVIDATAVRHALRPIAAAYAREAAIAEAREFLAGRQYLPAAQARTLVAHRRW